MARYHPFDRLKVQDELPRLEVPAALPDGRIPLDKLNEDLQIRILRFADMNEGDEFKLYVHSVYSGVTYTLSAEDETNPDFTVPLFIAKSDFPPDGRTVSIALDYEYVPAGASEGERSGKVVTVVFDREAPGGSRPRMLTLTDEQKEGITEENIEDGYLYVTLFPWFGMDVGDVLTPWVSESEPVPETEADFLLPAEEIEISEPGVDTTVRFPVASFAGVGTRYFAYQLRDELGNTSRLSATVSAPVEL